MDILPYVAVFFVNAASKTQLQSAFFVVSVNWYELHLLGHSIQMMLIILFIAL